MVIFWFSTSWGVTTTSRCTENIPPKLVLNQGARLSGGVWTLPSLETERVGEGFSFQKNDIAGKLIGRVFFLEGKGSGILGKIDAVIWMNLIRFMGLRKTASTIQKISLGFDMDSILKVFHCSHMFAMTSWRALSKWSGMAARKNG